MDATLLKLRANITFVNSRYFDIPLEKRSFKRSSEKWSKKEILGHLIDSARYNLMRFTEILFSDTVYNIVGYRQVELVTLQDY